MQKVHIAGNSLGGLVAIQVIGMPDQRFERYRRKEDWIQRYIFPGSLLPSVGALQRAMTRDQRVLSGLEQRIASAPPEVAPRL